MTNFHLTCPVVESPDGGYLKFFENYFERGTLGCEKIRGSCFIVLVFQKKMLSFLGAT